MKPSAARGFAKRYPQGSQEYLQQLEYEMALIRRMGFVEYFLIVSDFIGYAKSHGIPVGPGRAPPPGPWWPTAWRSPTWTP